MLADFIAFLKANSYYHEKEIKDISSTCCPTSTVKVLDFDRVKDDFSKLIGLKDHEKLKSMDTIFFSVHNDILYLIEMKRYDPVNSTLSVQDFVNQYLTKLPNKMMDTIFILLSIMGYFGITKAFYSYFLNPDKLNIHSFLLTDLPDRDLLPLTLANLDKLNISLTRRVNSEIFSLNCNSFNSRFGPRPAPAATP